MTWLELEPADFADAVGRRPLRFRHHLQERPHFTRASLVALVEASPPAAIEHHLGDLPLLLPDGVPERLNIDASAVARDIDGNGCWMIVWSAQRLPEYQQLLAQCVDQVAPFLPASEGVIEQQMANVLLSSAHSVVPVHFDRHHNLLLQIEGTKELMLGTFADPRQEQSEIARHFDVERNASALPTLVERYRLEPGEALYIPPYRLHWVPGDPATSVALSCVFQTTTSRRTELVHLYNSQCRRLHLRPRPPGSSEPSDRLKASVVRAARSIRRRARSAARRARHALHASLPSSRQQPKAG